MFQDQEKIICSLANYFRTKKKYNAYGFTTCHYYCVTFYKFLNKRQGDLLDGILKYLLPNLLETQGDEFDKIR